jgi:hypothetical protein
MLHRVIQPPGDGAYDEVEEFAFVLKLFPFLSWPQPLPGTWGENELRAVHNYAQRQSIRYPVPDGDYDEVGEMAMAIGMFPLLGWPSITVVESGHGSRGLSPIYYMSGG